MKKFRFPLARVLELRQRELDTAQSRVAALRNRRDALEAEAQRLDTNRRESAIQLLGKSALTGRELASAGRYAAEVDRRRRLSLAAARRVEAEEAAAVKTAVEARRKVRLLEILQSKRRRIHQAAFDKAVKDGVLTQAQADWMLQRMQGNWAGGLNGNCPMHNGGYGPNNGAGFRGGMMGRW